MRLRVLAWDHREPCSQFFWPCKDKGSAGRLSEPGEGHSLYSAQLPLNHLTALAYARSWLPAKRNAISDPLVTRLLQRTSLSVDGSPENVAILLTECIVNGLDNRCYCHGVCSGIKHCKEQNVGGSWEGGSWLTTTTTHHHHHHHSPACSNVCKNASICDIWCYSHCQSPKSFCLTQTLHAGEIPPSVSIAYPSNTERTKMWLQHYCQIGCIHFLRGFLW